MEMYWNLPVLPFGGWLGNAFFLALGLYCDEKATARSEARSEARSKND